MAFLVYMNNKETTNVQLDTHVENILKERYYLKDETSWSQVSKRLSETILPEMAEVIEARTFIPSTPTIMNLNTKGERKGTLSSCFILGIEDSMESIMESMKEAAFVTKAAGGVGYNFSALRGSNEIVKSNGRTSGGPLAFIGIFDAVLEGVRQGCCLTKDSLISTKDGLLKLEEIVKTREYGWHPHQLEILNRGKTQKSNNYYVNGVSDILQVNTEDGISIRGTPQHKLKVINSDGEEVWKEFQAIEKGDYAIVLLGQHEGHVQKLEEVSTDHFNQTSITLPKILDEKFAFILGYLSGDGFMASNERDYRIGFSVAHDSYLFDALPQKLKEVFGEVSVLRMQKKEDKSCTYVISNKQLKSFLLKNKIFKEKSDKVTVPELIRRSPKSVVGSYLRGLFEADGALSHGYPALCSVSFSLIQEVSALLLGLGCPNKITFSKKTNWLSDREGIYICRIQSTIGLDNWKKNIGCDPRSRFTYCCSFVSDLAREKVFVLPNVKSSTEKYDAFIQASSLPEKGKIHKQLLRYLRGDRRFSMSSYSYFKTRYPNFEDFVSIPSDVWYTKVTNVVSLPDEETYDIEVEESHAYIANGFLSHNSRRGAGMSMLSIFHPNILKFLDAKQKEGVFERSNFSVGIKNEFYEVLHTDPHRTFQTRNVVDGKLNDLVDEHGKTYTYQMLWDKIIHNAWNRAEPGIFNEDVSADRCSCKHITRNVFCNPCCHATSAQVHVKTLAGLKEIQDITSDDLIQLPDSTYAKTSGYFKAGVADVYSVLFSNGKTFYITKNHKLVTLRKGNICTFEELKDLRVGDYVSCEKIDYPVRIEEIKYHSTEEVGCINVPAVGFFITESGIISGNSEYTHIPYTSCNLGSINISRFVKGKKMDWKALEKLVEKTVIYLNGIIDQNDYPLEKIRKETLNVRPIGLGMMGLAHALYLKGIPYDSPEGYDFVAKLSRFMTLVGLRKSVELAKEHGKSYPYYDHATFMDANARFFTDDEFMGINVAQLKKDIAAYGIYNSCITSVAPTGCAVKNTKIVTDMGVLTLEQIFKENSVCIDDKEHEANQWYIPSKKISVMTLDGYKEITKLYINGKQDTIKIMAGQSKIEATHNHKILVRASEEATAWRRLDELKIGDKILLKNAELLEEEISSIERGNDYTYDIEVKDNHHYILNNGIISHNTISFLADCSSGMEPVFGLVFTRKIEKENKVYEHVYLVDPIFKKHIESNHAADAEKIYKYVSSNKGSCQGCKLLTPEEQAIFKVAGDITPDWHLQILAAVANNISLSCSKTLNLPSDCSEKEISDVFLKAHKLGIIGVTVYRDGCRRGILVHEEPKKEVKITKTIAPKRPTELEGEIYTINYKKDKLYVAVGMLGEDVYEVFAGFNIKNHIERSKGKLVKKGKSKYCFVADGAEYDLSNGGSDENADVICRTISAGLRHGCDLRFLVEQLGKSEGDFSSFAKVIARVLKKYIKDGESSTENCPKCETKLQFKEGCAACPSCGYSKCS